MPSETIRILGQVVPAANTLTPLYTNATAFGAAVSSIIICNQNAAITTYFNISFAVGGAADDPKQYLYYQLILDPYDTFIATIGVSIGAGDVIRVFSNQPNISFQAFGSELS